MVTATPSVPFIYHFFVIIFILAGILTVYLVHRWLKKSDEHNQKDKSQKIIESSYPTITPESDRTIKRRNDLTRIKPETIGKIGEMIVRTALGKKYQLPGKYILNNVLIPTKDGGTTEIDVLAITSRGVLIFECKNLAGNLYCDGEKERWLQYVGKEKHYFYNPLRQNYGHLKSLQEFLRPYGDVPIYAFFVPTDRGKWHFKNIRKSDMILRYNVFLPDFLAETPVSDSTNSIADALAELFKKYEVSSELEMELHKAYLAGKHSSKASKS